MSFGGNTPMAATVTTGGVKPNAISTKAFSKRTGGLELSFVLLPAALAFVARFCSVMSPELGGSNFSWLESEYGHVLFSAQLVAEFIVCLYVTDLISGLVHLNLDYQEISSKELRVHAETTIPDVRAFQTSDERFTSASKEDQYLWNFHSHHDAPYPALDSNFELVMQIVRPVSLPAAAIFATAYFGVLPMCLARILLLTAALAPLTQFTHFLAHARARGLVKSKLLMTMQDHHLILHPDVHKIHHTQFDREFCIFNGWANPLVNWLRQQGSARGLLAAEAPTISTRKERAETGNKPTNTVTEAEARSRLVATVLPSLPACLSTVS